MNLSTVQAWLGPVNLTQVGSAVVPGLKAINLTCTGDGKPSCAEIAEGFVDANGRRLPNLLVSKGADPHAEVIIGAFSAGGSVAKRLALNPDDREQIKAMMLADATYTIGGVDEGFVLYALDCIHHTDRMFVATASSAPNKNYPTGIQTLALLRAEVERRAGMPFSSSTLPGVSPQPAAVWRLGNVIFCEFPNVSHGDQVTKLAGQVWKAMLLPWLELGPAPKLPSTGSDLGKWLVALAGLGLGYTVVRGVQRNRAYQRRYRGRST